MKTVLPGSCYRVGAPESLQAEPPATVVVANAVYESEVRDRLATLELAPEVVSL